MRRTVRHELKYQLTPGNALLLRARLDALLPRDPHAGPDGYFIRSLYFDDVDDTAFYDKLAGVKERAKYRLRFYNMDGANIFFECKRKHGALVEKDSAPVTRAVAEAMIVGRPLPESAWDVPLLAEFLALRDAVLLRPRVLVDYTRMAYILEEEHTRVTLDFDVRSGLYRTRALFDPVVTLPAAEDGNIVLEVKFDRYLPARARDALAALRMLPGANSKYCGCVLPTV